MRPLPLIGPIPSRQIDFDPGHIVTTGTTAPIAWRRHSMRLRLRPEFCSRHSPRGPTNYSGGCPLPGREVSLPRGPTMLRTRSRRDGLHADRAAGRHRHHRHPDGPAAAGRPESPRSGSPGQMREQPQAARPRVTQLSRRLPILPPGVGAPADRTPMEPWTNANTYASPTTPPNLRVQTWLVHILPFIEQDALKSSLPLNPREPPIAQLFGIPENETVPFRSRCFNAPPTRAAGLWFRKTVGSFHAAALTWYAGVGGH